MSTKDASIKDAQNKLRKEEYALGTEQSLNYVALTDAPRMLSVKESVGDTGESTLRTTNLLLLDQNTKRTLPLLIHHIRTQLMH